MSGIAGIIHFDGKPVEPGLIEKMTSAMAHRGPDGINHWVKGSVALGQCMLRTTPESLEEHQPLTNEDESLVLVMDGRVDNWEELRRELLGRGAVLRDRSDAELVLRAYEVWGEDSPYHILGDFAYALWDGQHRELFCARDIVGIRPFYYFEGSNYVIIASELHTLFCDDRVDNDPNIGMIAEYLSAEFISKTETLYKRIYRLRPGNSLIIGMTGIVTRQYWKPNVQAYLNYKYEDQYIEHLIEVMKRSVQSRLRSTGSIGVRMSGGLDSTSVLGVAQSLIRIGQFTSTNLETFSLVFPGQNCEESKYIRKMNDFSGAKCNLVPYWIADVSHYISHAKRYKDCSDTPNGTMNVPLKRLVNKKGIRVLLTGWGGDEWFWGSRSAYFYTYEYLIRDFRFLDLLSILFNDTGNLIEKSKRLTHYGIFPLLPEAVKNSIRKVINIRTVRQRRFPWITPNLMLQSGLDDRLKSEPNDDVSFISKSQEILYRSATNASEVSTAEVEDLTSSDFSIEQRHPLWDRRVIEFALTLPSTLRWQPPYKKYILRKAMGGLLPEAVRWRTDETIFDVVFVQAMEKLGGAERMSNLLPINLGWVDGKEVSKMYENLQYLYRSGSGGYEIFMWPLWMIYSIDIWLRQSLIV